MRSWWKVATRPGGVSFAIAGTSTDTAAGATYSATSGALSATTITLDAAGCRSMHRQEAFALCALGQQGCPSDVLVIFPAQKPAGLAKSRTMLSAASTNFHLAGSINYRLSDLVIFVQEFY